MTQERETYFSTAEVAQQLECHYRTVIRYIEDGSLPGAFKMNPKKRNSPYKIPKSSVDAFVVMRQAAG